MKIFSLMISCVFCVCLSGCNEGMSSDQIRQARLVGNENLLLKKQIQEKDGAIAAKNALIQKKETQIAELTKQLEQAKQQVVMAQDKTAQLEKTFSEASATYQKQIEECQKNLEAKPVPCSEVEEKYAAEFASLLEKWTECENKLAKYEPAAADAYQTEK